MPLALPALRRLLACAGAGVAAVHALGLPLPFLFGRWCQANANGSPHGQDDCPLCRAELTPLGKCGGAVQGVLRGGAARLTRSGL